MQMLYNSDNFAVVAIDALAESGAEAGPLSRGGFEIVDKFARKGIFIEGAVAESFQQGVRALVARGPDQPGMQEALDDYIAGYTRLGQLPLVLH